MNDNKIIEICSECLTASCWYGEFMCDEAREGGTIKKTVHELRELNLENEGNWSDERMEDIYGVPYPHGYKGTPNEQIKQISAAGRPQQLIINVRGEKK